MATHPGIVFVVCLFCLNSFTDSRILPLVENEKIPPFCSRMCHSSLDIRENILYRHKCSCSHGCAAYGDCCYDSPYKDMASQFTFSCLSVDKAGDFLAVSSCPQNNPMDACSEKLGHLPPVTSKTTNITYGNVFCASCNGDGSNLIEWNVELRCAVDGTRRKCTFYVTDLNYKFFSDLELRPCNKPSMKSKCSYSWRDESVEQICRSYEDPIYIHNDLYRNPHCAKCNYEKLSIATCIPSFLKEMLDRRIIHEDSIKSCMSKSPYECITVWSRGIDYGISSLFGSEIEVGKISQKECTVKGEQYDPNTEKCQSVVTR